MVGRGKLVVDDGVGWQVGRDLMADVVVLRVVWFVNRMVLWSSNVGFVSFPMDLFPLRVLLYPVVLTVAHS